MGCWEPQENALRMKKKVERRPDRIPDARYQGKVERRPDRNSGCEMPGWDVGGEEFRMWDNRVECRRRRIPDVRHPDKVETLAGQNSGCETIGWNVAGKDSRCETSGWNVGGEEFWMWYVRVEWAMPRVAKGHLRAQGRGSYVTLFRENPTLSIPSSYHHHSPSTNLPRFRVLKLDSLFQRKNRGARG